MAAGIGVVVPPEVRRLLEERAVEEGTALSRVAADILSEAVGVEPPPRPERLYARNVVPRLVALARERGGLTVAEAAEESGLTRGAARRHLNVAAARGLLVAREDGGPTRTKTYRPAGWAETMAAPPCKEKRPALSDGPQHSALDTSATQRAEGLT